jgi:hypothetical protein
MKAASALLVLLIAGCTPIPAENASGTIAAPRDPNVPIERAEGRCDADAAKSAIGKAASSQLLEDARTKSGTATARYLRPGQVVTMEYRADRLNIRLNAKDVVETISCG